MRLDVFHVLGDFRATERTRGLLNCLAVARCQIWDFKVANCHLMSALGQSGHQSDVPFCPLLPQSEHASEVQTTRQWTSAGAMHMSAFDPKRTLDRALKCSRFADCSYRKSG